MKKLLIVAALGFLTACNSDNSDSKDTSSGENNAKAGFVGDVPTRTLSFINKDTANVMIESYLLGNKDDSSALASLIVDADALRAYLADSSIKNVKLMFAHTLDYINSGHQGIPCGYTSGELTLILAGYDVDGNYTFYKTDKVMDHFMPCPNTCPTNGTAQYNTFPAN